MRHLVEVRERGSTESSLIDLNRAHGPESLVDQTARLWRTDTGELVAVLRGHRGSVNAVLFTTDGRFLLTAGDDGIIHAWPTQPARLIELARARLERAAHLAAEQAVVATPLTQFKSLLGGVDPAAASTVGRQIVQRAIDQGDFILLNQIAWEIVDPAQSYAQRDLELAEWAATQAASAAHADPNAIDTLARVYFWKRDYRHAIEVQRRAVTAAPARPDLRAALAEYERLAGAGVGELSGK